MLRLTLFLFISFFALDGYTQDKYEKEVRLKEELVPQNAIDFVSKIPFSKKVRWYKETGLASTSVEAKTKHLGVRYSIEFSMEGVLEDAELKVEFDKIPKEARKQISDYLTKKYGKYEIIKAQVQYSGKEEDVLSFLISKNDTLPIQTKYELVVGTKVDRVFKSFEYLFSVTGNYIQSAKIVKKNTVNIEF